jgi:tetratricopeptide (TPR) repeat protein
MWDIFSNIAIANFIDIKDVIKIAGGTIGAAVLGLLYRWWRRRRVGPSPDTHFAILVPTLDVDTDGQQTRHILQSLERQFMGTGNGTRMHILAYPDVLTVAEGERSAAIAAAERKGRQWLKAKNADVLVWGEVAESNKVLRLRFLSQSGYGGGAKAYRLNEGTLELPANFNADLGAVLAVQAATSIEPIYERGGGEALANVIEPVVAKLGPLAENPPASFADEDKARLWEAFAKGEQRLGEERGQNTQLETAIRYYGKVLGVSARERVPLAWARTKDNLGTALRRLGEREGGTARLEEAVAAFRAALEERTRERVPLDWATTQDNLGIALRRLGERESGTARLEEAVAACRETLKERTRERVPLAWARTQTNLGAALWRLGERESGTARLEEAVAACREALKELTRERVPLAWATTQTNLGNALRSLGERRAEKDKPSGCRLLTEAQVALAAALEEARNSGASHYVSMAQSNLGLVDAAIARLGCQRF